MPRTQHKKKSSNKTKSKSKMTAQTELRSWAEIISEKILTDYALPLTKNAEARLHELSEKIEENISHPH